MDEDAPRFVTKWNKARKKKVIKPTIGVCRNIKKRRTNVGEEATKASRSNKFDRESKFEE